MQITKELIDKIHSLADQGLKKGLGYNISQGDFCAEQAITIALGEPLSDSPSCVGNEVRITKISLNDSDWSSDKARAEGMRKLLVAQLGSDQLDQTEFKLKFKLNSTKRILPYIIQKHYERCKDEKLLAYKKKFEQLSELNDELWDEFFNNYNYYYYYYYYDYYYDYYHYKYYYNYYDNYYFGDEYLLLIADTILQTLKEMNCEGCKWL